MTCPCSGFTPQRPTPEPPVLSPNAGETGMTPNSSGFCMGYGTRPPLPGWSLGTLPGREGTSQSSHIFPGGAQGRRQHLGGGPMGVPGQRWSPAWAGGAPHGLRSGFLRFVRIFAGKGGAGGGWCRIFPEAEPAAAALALGHGSPPASQRICALPRGDWHSGGGGYLGPVVCLPTPELHRDGKERRVGCEGFIRPSRQNPFQMCGCRCWRS